jgi:hypothetical protein
LWISELSFSSSVVIIPSPSRLPSLTCPSILYDYTDSTTEQSTETIIHTTTTHHEDEEDEEEDEESQPVEEDAEDFDGDENKGENEGYSDVIGDEKTPYRSKDLLRECLSTASDSGDMASFLKDYIDLHDQKNRGKTTESLVIHEQHSITGRTSDTTRALMDVCDESSDDLDAEEDFPAACGDRECVEREYHYTGLDGRLLPLYQEPDMYVLASV